MSTSKHIDKICVAVIAVTLVLTLLFMSGSALGISVTSRNVKYESTLFDASYVHTIDIVMDDWDEFLESCENEEYAPCTVVADGNKVSNVAIRAKGNTSLSSVKSMGSQRYSFKLEFDHYQDGKTLDGLDKLCLNNLIQDNTMMKDYLVYQLMNSFGVDSPLCSFAYLTVNGEDWGLYLAVEGIEDSFLDRVYGSEQGELYKPDSLSFGGGRGNGKDFSMDDFDFSDVGELPSDSADSFSSQWPGSFSGFGGDASGDTQQGGFSGEMPQMPENFDGDFSGMSGQGGGFSGFEADSSDSSESSFPFSGGSIPQMPEGFDGDFSEMFGQNGSFSGGNLPGGFGGFGGMGSSDVKLQYSDDDPDSYSNIFDNAKTDVSASDKKRLISALKNLSTYSDLENTVAMEEVMRYFVVHNFVCNGDSYTGSMIHNYYLHESDGIMSMIPWDYNLAFGTFQGNDASGTVNTDIDNPVSGGSVDDRPMLGWIFSDESYTSRYHELFGEFITEWFDSGKLASMIEETAEMLRPYVEKDPTKFCTTEEFDAGVAALSDFVSLRAEAVRRQLSGDDTAVDTTGLNLSDMGTMGGGMGGGMSRTSDGEARMPNAGFSGNSDENRTSSDQSAPSVPEAQEATDADPSGDARQSGGFPGGQMPQMPGNTGGGFPGGSQPSGGFSGGQMPQMPGDTNGGFSGGGAQGFSPADRQSM